MPPGAGARRLQSTSTSSLDPAGGLGGLRSERPAKRGPADAALLEGQRKKPKKSPSNSGRGGAAGYPPEGTVASGTATTLQAISSWPQQLRTRQESRLSALFFRAGEESAASVASSPMHPTALPALKNVSVEYVRSMLFEVIRDGEVSDSERKMMLWSIIILAQVRDKCPDIRIAVPSCPQALGRYMATQGGVIGELMDAVQGGPDEGVRESVFAERSPRSRAWVGSLEAEAGAPEGSAERAVASAAERGLGWLMHLTGTGELEQQVTAEELLLAFEPPQEVDLCARHGPVLGACLGSLGPIVPEAYMFRARAADFYRLCCSRERIDRDLLLLALRFFLAAFLYAQVKKVPTFIVGALYVRVFICTFDEHTWVLGWPVQILRLLAEKATDWDKNDEWVGCPDDGSPSAIQWLPDRMATMVSSCLTVATAFFLAAWLLFFQHAYILWRLKSSLALILAVPVGWVAAAVAVFIDWALFGALASLLSEAVSLVFQPVARAVLNYTFAVVLAKLLVRVVDIADEVVQPKLVLMSLKLGSRTRAAHHVP
mmetsp:Transcript_29273/g.92355  ORF Transcript_29273/g.92355 Transcript_29273/m.92355 type:complete len:544 (-) Transcript_29273:100-1731(-)